MPRWVDPGADVRAWLRPAWIALQARHEEGPGLRIYPGASGGARSRIRRGCGSRICLG